MIRRATPSSDNWPTSKSANWMFPESQFDVIRCRDTRSPAMYTPPAFRDDDRANLLATMRAARLGEFVTATVDGPLVTPLPLLVDESEGEHGVIYGHLAKPNPQWRIP